MLQAGLIPIKLTESENYGVWSRSMRISLLGKRIWFRNSEKLLSGVVYDTSAFAVWADLKERFDKVNRMRIYQLHREITTLSQELVQRHYSIYKPACAIIIEDEIQHSACLVTVNEKPDPIAMRACRDQGTQNYNQRNSNYRGRKVFSQCEYCHFTGHTKENCYKLIGYPADWKQRRKIGNGNGHPKGTSGHGNSVGCGNFGTHGGQSSNSGGYENFGPHGGQSSNNGQHSFA
ncbi:hypothetical protein KY290_011157 [Solanum tuberosum]|uniref:Retrotransposon Copia-like N-terminal domain-containing protein n=1 Tax=Solanum tuberosum TaxID=4113 RepID=A0ABQ7W0B1_SOLTU|nr:hypothetical protein KY290_011157 [Solanum tuberosum]